MEEWAGFSSLKEHAVCRCCGHTVVSASTKMIVHSDHFNIGQSPILPLSFPSEVTYMECVKCGTAIYCKGLGWYPNFPDYQRRYEHLQEPVIKKSTKGFTSSILDAALAKLEGD